MESVKPSMMEVHVIDHPLKDEESGKKLQLVLFNLISLGEWEVSASILRSLAANPDEKLRAKQFLRALVVGANDYW